jgi:rubrerythrin
MYSHSTDEATSHPLSNHKTVAKWLVISAVRHTLSRWLCDLNSKSCWFKQSIRFIETQTLNCPRGQKATHSTIKENILKRLEIKTVANLESAFAGESMAHIKYRYFAKIARAAGDEETARVFEETADQEVQHAFGHLDLLYPKETMTPARCLQMAIEGETYEYTEMYPGFLKTAQQEGNAAAAAEITGQIAESKEHAEQFQAMLRKAAKRFAALAKVEERHANQYRAVLAKVSS